MKQVCLARRDRLGFPNYLERAGGIADGELYPGRGSQNCRIGRGSGGELIGQRSGFGTTAE
jgi:hypothetical protein